MPADFNIKTGDMILITIPPPAVVPMLLAPVPLIGTSSNVMIMNMPACMPDGCTAERIKPAIAGPMPYMAPPHVTPGMGMLTIVLLPTNVSMMASNQKPMLIKGATFQAIFSVQAPAMMPTPAGPVPDPLMVKMGTAQFITTNMVVKSA